MIDQLLDYAIPATFALAILAYGYHWYRIWHIKNNPPWKTGPDLRGDQRNVLTGLDETQKRIKRRRKE